jgi:hypothetical protein
VADPVGCVVEELLPRDPLEISTGAASNHRVLKAFRMVM